MRRAIVLSQAAALLCLIAAACGRQPHDIDFNPGIVYAMSALPFVEGVVLPDTIVADEPFEVRLKLSAALRPELLNGAGLANPLWSNSARFMQAPDPSFAWGDGNLVRIETWFTYERNPDGPKVLDAPPSDEAVFLLALPASEYELVVSSADTREYGGMEHRIQVIPTFAPLYIRMHSTRPIRSRWRLYRAVHRGPSILRSLPTYPGRLRRIEDE